MADIVYRFGIGVKNKLLEWHHALLEWQPDNQPWVVALRMFRFAGVKEALKRDPVHYCKRLGWILVFSTCLSYGISMCMQTWRQYVERPILHAFHDSGGVSLDRIPFPAVTVASPYLFKRSVMEKALKMYSQILEDRNSTTVTDDEGVIWNEKEIIKLIHMIDHICAESGSSFAKKFKGTHENRYFDLHKYTSWVKEQNTSLYDTVLDSTIKRKVIPYVKKGLINCTDVLLSCVWRGITTQKCSKLFKMVQTDVGTGCGFNKIPERELRTDWGLKSILHNHKRSSEDKFWRTWSIDKHPFLGLGQEVIEMIEKEFPRRQVSVGFDKGISFVIKYQKNNRDTACPVIDSKHYRICIHHPFEEPRMKVDGCVHVPPTKQVFIKVQVKLTLPDPNIRSLIPEKRKCYFEGEKKLDLFQRYTQSNCFKDCFAKEIIKMCECNLLSTTTGNDEMICGPLNQKCVQNVTDSFEMKGNIWLCQECYRSCTEIVYKLDAAYSDVDFDNPKVFGLGQTDNFALVHVFFNEESIINRERSRRLDFNELVGVLGGIIGLTNGVDILQMFNVLAGLSMFCSIIWKAVKRSLWRWRQVPGVQQTGVSLLTTLPAVRSQNWIDTGERNNGLSLEETQGSDATFINMEEYPESSNSNQEPMNLSSGALNSDGPMVISRGINGTNSSRIIFETINAPTPVDRSNNSPYYY